MNDLERLVLRQIGESVTNPDVFTSDNMGQIRTSINDAVQEIAMLTGGIKQTYLIPLQADVNFYKIWFQSDYFGWVTDAWIVNTQRRLSQTDRYRLEKIHGQWLKHNGTPEVYMQVGLDVVGIYPSPSSSSDVLELTCTIIPARYERDTERVRVRDVHKWAVVHHAVAEYYASRGDAQQAIHHLEKYAAMLKIDKYHGIADETRYRARTDKDPWPTESSRRPYP